jgi:multiple sugar transport system substrate-binding protein
MFMSSRRSTPTFRQITAFDWDIAALPRHDRPASVLHSDAYCMTTASGNKDAAWRFMEFALGAEGQGITAATGRTVPSLIEVSTSEAFLDPKARPANSRVFLDTIPVIQRLPNVSTWPEIEDVANTILERAFYDDQPAATTATEIVQQTQPIFARATY